MNVTFIAAVLFAGLGLIVGSFLNVVAIRLLKGERIDFPPSHCVHCGHRLHARDLVPLLSYLLLRGRCRYCRERVSARYPAGEAAAAILFAVAYLVVGYRAELAAALFLIAILIVVTQTDLEAMIIPNAVVLVGIAGLAVLRLWTHPLPLWNYAAAMVLGSGLLLLVGVVVGRVLGREALGGGDVKLYVALGLALGLKLTVFSLFAASVIGLLYGLALKLSGRYERYKAIPFGPYIAAGALLVYFWGDRVLDWYLSLFLPVT